MEDVQDVLREALVSAPTPRVLTGLAPVLVVHAGALRLSVVEDQLARVGLAHRLGWLVENTVAAIHELLPRTSHRTRKQYLLAELSLKTWLRRSRPTTEIAEADTLEVVRSEKTRSQQEQRRSEISTRWNIITDLQPRDFVAALEAAHAAG